MKLIFSTLLLMFISLSASAQTEVARLLAYKSDFAFIPEKYTKNNQQYLIHVDGINGTPNSYNYTLYDEDLNVVKTFAFPPYKDKEYTTWKYRQKEYDGEGNVHYTDVWTENVSESEFSGSSVFRLERYTSSGDSEYFPVTQTLFNDDELFEYIVPVYTKKLVETEYTDSKTGDVSEIFVEDGPVITGFQIVSEEGTVLNSIGFEGGILTNWFPQILEIGNKTYLTFDYMDNKNKGPYSVFYLLDSKTNGVRQVAVMEGSMRVNPTIADSSQQITVEVAEDGKSHEVMVVNAAGQVVKKAFVPAGQRSVQINASDLSQGLNIVNLVGGNSNCKIVVK